MRLKDLLMEEIIRDNISGHLGQTERNVIDGHFENDYSKVDVDGDFYVYDCPLLLDLVGSPRSCLDFRLEQCPSLTSLQGAPMIVKGKVELWGGRKLTSLAGIGKDYLKEIHETFQISIFIKSHILGFLRVKKLKQVVFYSGAGPSAELRVVVDEINNQLDWNRDMLECKEKLIAMGYKEYGKL